MGLEILKPGLSTTVQDLGRFGYYHLGIPESGGMDKSSLAAANLLVGNPEGAAVLEAVFLGPEIRFDRDAVVAVCGAHMPPKVDGVEQPGWTSFTVKSGQTLSFGFLKSGARAYIAVAGGVDVPLVLGSRSTYPLGALGGFEGRALKAGDRLKALWWDRTGYCLLYKRLERGTFRIPTVLRPGETSIQLDADEFAKILEGLDLPKGKLQVGAMNVKREAQAAPAR